VIRGFTTPARSPSRRTDRALAGDHLEPVAHDDRGGGERGRGGARRRLVGGEHGQPVARQRRKAAVGILVEIGAEIAAPRASYGASLADLPAATVRAVTARR